MPGDGLLRGGGRLGLGLGNRTRPGRGPFRVELFACTRVDSNPWTFSRVDFQRRSPLAHGGTAKFASGRFARRQVTYWGVLGGHVLPPRPVG